MLSLRDCLDMAEVSEAEIAAIARHENIPQLLALELGQELMRTPAGRARLQRFIVEDIERAQAQHRCRDCAAFSRTLADFLDKQTPPPAGRPSNEAERRAALLAVGRAKEMEDEGLTARGPKAALLRQIRRAKGQRDCCACLRFCLKLVA